MTLVAQDDRDSKIHELEDKIQRLEKRNQRLQLAQGDAAKEVIDAIGRSKRLAQSIGFQEAAEAQLYIDSLDDELDLRQLVQRAKHYEEGAAGSATDYDQLKAEHDEMTQKLEDMREKRKADATNGQEVIELRERYDALLVDRLRSSEYFKRYYAKFKQFNKWWTTHDPKAEPDWDQLSDTEKKIRKERFISRRCADIAQFGITIGKDGDDHGVLRDPTNTPKPAGTNKPTEFGKENGEVSLPPTKKRRVSSPTLQTSSHNTGRLSFPLQPFTTQTVANTAGPSFSPTIFNKPKIEPTSPRLTSDTPSKPRQEGLLASGSLRRSYAIKSKHPPSSETEDDWEEDEQPEPKQAIPEREPSPSQTSPTERSSRWKQELATPLLKRPLSTPLAANVATNCKTSLWSSGNERDDASRPLELSDLKPADSTSKRGVKPPSPTSKLYIPPGSRAEDPKASAGSNAKGKMKALAEDVSTPLTAKAQRMDPDYSVFKGRGRYGKASEKTRDAGTPTFVIDPQRNGGVAFQFDTVVRNREERKKLHGGDCECCRDYYENVGPLPPRLKQPLWRSPTKTPARAEDQSNTSEANDVEAHRKSISRHRHEWARAKTPPSYWDIGFPNTQQVEIINEKAKDMHKRKQDDIEKEAMTENGRYRRRAT